MKVGSFEVDDTDTPDTVRTPEDRYGVRNAEDRAAAEGSRQLQRRINNFGVEQTFDDLQDGSSTFARNIRNLLS